MLFVVLYLQLHKKVFVYFDKEEFGRVAKP